LNVAPGSGLIISGSWDKTARVWTYTAECVCVLRGHESAVWAVLSLMNGDILTGSADKMIKMWRNGLCYNTLKAHTDCVRGLKEIPNRDCFFSCGNDAQILCWSLKGELMYTLSGHHSFIYSLTVLNTDEIASGSEDRSVRIWKGMERRQQG
jgi:phospholipase A-2-activating protein